MAEKKLLSADSDEYRKIVFHKEDGKTRVETKQNVDPIIRAAKMLSETTPDKDMRHAAFIPKTVLDQALTEGWFHDPKAWKKWANDPANECYRTWKGRL